MTGTGRLIGVCSSTPRDDVVERSADERWLFGWFSALLALALVLDQLWWGGFELWSPHSAVILAAVGALARPTSVARFTAMTATMVVSVAIDMPFVGSHRLFALIIGAAVLGYLAWIVVATRRVPTPAEVFGGIAPFLRTSVLVLYVFAALAKLNTDFVDPATSCAVSMAPQITWFDPSLLDARRLARPAIWATVLIEAALPVLLAVRRTRLVALALGAGFHTVLALAGNVPYSALVLALYVTFLPTDTPRRLRARLQTPAGWGPAAPAHRRVLAALAITVPIVGWLIGAAMGTAQSAPGLLGPPSELTSSAIGDATRAVVMVIVVTGAAALALSRRGAPRPPRYADRDLRPRNPLLLAAVLILALNGLCPYLGLKTDASFEMFSGLRTEPGAWNHLFVPETLRVFGYQNSLITVISTNDPRLPAPASRVPAFELDRYLRTHPGAVATVTSAGQTGAQTLGPLPDGPTLAHHIAVFRDVPPPGHTRC